MLNTNPERSLVNEDPRARHRSVHRQVFSDFGAWDGLTDSERTLLTHHGVWLEALADSRLRPITPEQIDFVKVCQGLCKPKTVYEMVWVKYEANRRAFYSAKRHRLVELARESGLSTKQLDSILNNANLFGFCAEELSLFQSELIRRRSLEWGGGRSVSCQQCGGDGGAGGRCPKCGGNGLES